MTLEELLATYMVTAVHLKPGLRPEHGPACINLEVIGGPKRYARYWVEDGTVDWGWTLHDTSVQLMGEDDTDTP